MLPEASFTPPGTMNLHSSVTTDSQLPSNVGTSYPGVINAKQATNKYEGKYRSKESVKKTKPIAPNQHRDL